MTTPPLMTLQDAFKIAYPTGERCNEDFDALPMEATEKQVQQIAAELEQLLPLRISHERRLGGQVYWGFAATMAPAPTFDDWLDKHDAAARLAYLAQHGGTFPVWWVNFSFVFPAWHHGWNSWSAVPSPQPHASAGKWTGTMPSAAWTDIVAQARTVIARHGFTEMLSAQLDEEVPSVTYEVYPDGDSSAPPQIKCCTVAQCLFT